ncbi:MAG: ABC transporter ATP-binding protein [bacterium]
MSESSKVLYKFENVSFNYFKEKPIFNNLNFEINVSDKVSILGPNGAGKSTLLNLLNGLVFPTSGKVICGGMELNKVNLAKWNNNHQFRRKCAYVFQNPEVQLLCPTVREELAFGLDQLGIDKANIVNFVDLTAKKFNIEKLLDSHPYNLSIGQKKLVGLASVLILNTGIILFDEPTTSLDLKTKKLIVDVLEKLKNSDKTIIISTHDLDIAEQTSNKTILLNKNNEICAIDETHKIINNRELLEQAELI